MSTFGAGSTGTYIAAGVVAAGVAVGGYVYVTSQQEPVVTPETPAVVAVPAEQPSAPTVVEAAPAPAPEITPPEETATAPVEVTPVAPIPPTFDVVRVEADGSAIIAGLAAAGAEVFVYLGEDEIAKTDADSTGNFVALATIAPSAAPQVVSLVMRADGVDTPSDATVIIAPQPVAVAEAPETPTVDTPAEAAIEAIGIKLTGTAQTGGNDLPEETVEVQASTPAAAEPAAPTVEAGEPAPVAVEAPDVVTEAVPEPTGVPTTDAVPTVLIADNDGVRIVQGAEEVAPSEITIDAISYGDNGDAILTGRGDADAVARVYLNNAITGETAVDPSGDWSLALTDVAAGIYTLRVDQIDGTGAVTSRFETPFKREDPVLVAAAAAPEPASIKEEIETPTPVVDTPPTPAPTEPVAEAVTETTAPAAPAPRVTAVTVQPGFTLWKIAKDAYGQGDLYVQVFDANKDAIKNPDLIYPGQVFEVPNVSAQ